MSITHKETDASADFIHVLAYVHLQSVGNKTSAIVNKKMLAKCLECPPFQCALV